jgi:hypothetical protein
MKSGNRREGSRPLLPLSSLRRRPALILVSRRKPYKQSLPPFYKKIKTRAGIILSNSFFELSAAVRVGL